MFKDSISYFDIFFPFFVLYLIFLILAFIKNRKDKWNMKIKIIFLFLYTRNLLCKNIYIKHMSKYSY